MAHELNDPAAATARGVAQLRPLIEGLQDAYLELSAAPSARQTMALQRAGERVLDVPPKLGGGPAAGSRDLN